MSAPADSTVNATGEISHPLPVSPRKDLTKQRRQTEKRRSRKRRTAGPDQASPQGDVLDDQDLPAAGQAEDQPPDDKAAGGVDYLA